LLNFETINLFNAYGSSTKQVLEYSVIIPRFLTF